MNINVNNPKITDIMFNMVFEAVKPGNTMNVIIANAPNPTNIGDAVFFEKTFLSMSFIYYGFSKFVKYG